MILKFDYLVDLHTASRGRKNSLYVRADMNQPTIKEMAQSLQPQIIVHNSSPGGSIRGCAQSAGINAVTVEVSNERTSEATCNSWLTLASCRLEIAVSFSLISSKQPT